MAETVLRQKDQPISDTPTSRKHQKNPRRDIRVCSGGVRPQSKRVMWLIAQTYHKRRTKVSEDRLYLQSRKQQVSEDIGRPYLNNKQQLREDTSRHKVNRQSSPIFCEDLASKQLFLSMCQDLENFILNLSHTRRTHASKCLHAKPYQCRVVSKNTKMRIHLK